MREAEIAAFEYRSARDPDGGLNVALFDPSALGCEQPSFTEEWLCEVNGEHVTFLMPTQRRTRTFPAIRTAVAFDPWPSLTNRRMRRCEN